MESLDIQLFGKDPKVIKALNLAMQMSVTKNPVLITGEFGVGKKSLGRFIHENSTRKSSPLLTVDCSEDSQQVENKILGFRDEETGRFTKGILELANGGTIILANVEGLSEAFQKKLHQIFLELPDYDIDLRIIVTTSKNLSKLVGASRFYRAFYIFILNTQINIPPLRERKNDILHLSDIIVKNFCTKMNMSIPQISEEVKEKILSNYWTQNICELTDVWEKTLEDFTEDEITLENLSIGERRIQNNLPDEEEEGFKLMSLKEAEKMLIRKALVYTVENRTQAAKILGVSIRTLRNKINEYRNEGASYFVNLR